MNGIVYNQPQTASGTNWVSSNNSLSLGGGYASYPTQNSPSQWLALTNLSNRAINTPGATISGVQVNLFMIGTGGPPPVTLGLASRVFQGNVSDTVTTTGLTTDGNNATYYGDANPGASATSLTVIHDFGEIATVTSAIIMTRSVNGSTASFHYSNDGSTWTPVPRSGPGVVGAGGDLTDNFTVNGTVSARYWRATITESGNPSNQVRLYTFELYNGATLMTPGYVQTGGTERIEVALTKDGTNPVGATKTVILSTTDATYTIGDANDLWGTTLTTAEVGASTFGFLVRRSQSGGEMIFTERRVDFVNSAISYSFVPVASMRPAALQSALLGKQVDRETPAALTIRSKSFALRPQPQNENKEYDGTGDLVPIEYAVTYEKSNVTASFDPSFDEMGLLLASVFGKPSSQLVSTGVYRHTFVVNTKGVANPQFYTTQFGDSNHAETTASVLLSSFGMDFQGKKSISGSVGGFGRKVDGTTDFVTVGANCVQTLTAPTGAPTSFRLKWGGQETADITVAGMSASTIQTAIQATSSMSTNVTVSGSGPWVITFGGALAGVPQPLIEVSKITGGTSPTVPLTITTPGGFTELPFTPIIAGNLRAYYADTVANLSNSAKKLTTLLKGSINLDNRFTEIEVTDDANVSWGPTAETNMNLGAKVSVSADDVSAGMETDARNRTPMFFRLQATGGLIGVSAVNYSLTFDMACKVKMIGTIQDEGAVIGRDFELGARFDAAWGQTMQFTLVNSVASY